MANIKYFADTTDGRTLEFTKVAHDYKGFKVAAYDAESGQWIGCNRKVEYKSSPSRHECDARCVNANGRTMNCECSCGGKNHGKGRFACVAD